MYTYNNTYLCTLKLDADARAIEMAKYLISKDCTIRELAGEFNVSKSRAHTIVTRYLTGLNAQLAAQVKETLDRHREERASLGGRACWEKYRGAASILKLNATARVIDMADYLIINQCTLSKVAQKFGLSKSRVHRILSEDLPKINTELAAKVKTILANNLYRGIASQAARREAAKIK